VLITAALPYANGPLHLGHLRSTYLPADVYARYCRLRGHEALFVCASDEHGAPIELKAREQGVAPEAFTRQWRERHLEDFARAGIRFDHFGSTHSPENRDLTNLFHSRLKQGGHFFTQKVKQAFCPKDERFLPDRYVRGTCPHCGTAEQYGDSCEACGRAYSPAELKEPMCALCGTAPEVREVEHVFFRLSGFRSFLAAWLADNPHLPKDVVHYVRNWVDSGLQDWDITRDGPYHGFEIPGEKGKYFYVWFDAPIGYLAATAALERTRGGRWDAWWAPESDADVVHFVGKDIVYHHFLFWPAMLKGANLRLPTHIPTRGYLNIEQEKMSKSRGTLIEVRDFLAKYPADFLRYYLTAITPNNVTDGSFSWHEFRQKVNAEFLDAFGNYAYRVLSFLERRFAGFVPQPRGMEDEDLRFQSRLEEFTLRLEPSFEALDFKGALEQWLAFAGECNAYFSEREPWRLGRHKRGDVETVLYLATKAVYALSLAALPLVPESAEKILAQLNLASAPRRWGDYTAFKPGLQVRKPEILHPKIEEPKSGAVPEGHREPGKKVT
jgi:methionyl-tRNA synthetase